MYTELYIAVRKWEESDNQILGVKTYNKVIEAQHTLQPRRHVERTHLLVLQLPCLIHTLHMTCLSEHLWTLKFKKFKDVWLDNIDNKRLKKSEVALDTYTNSAHSSNYNLNAITTLK